MLDSDLLLRIYSAGCFPMWDEANEETGIFRPDPRAIIELERGSTCRGGSGKTHAAACRSASRPISGVRGRAGCLSRRPGRRLLVLARRWRVGYLELHERGFAHSVEAWLG